MENHPRLIKSAVASCVKQHLLSTEWQQRQQVKNHIHYFLRKPIPLPTERAVGVCGKSNHCLNLIWVGFLGVRFEVRERVKLPPVYNPLELCQKLENWYLSTYIYIVSQNIPFRSNALLILLMSVLSSRKTGNNSTFTQSKIVRAVLEFF